MTKILDRPRTVLPVGYRILGGLLPVLLSVFFWLRSSRRRQTKYLRINLQNT